jgi:hypothetical protein
LKLRRSQKVWNNFLNVSSRKNLAKADEDDSLKFRVGIQKNF